MGDLLSFYAHFYSKHMCGSRPVQTSSQRQTNAHTGEETCISASFLPAASPCFERTACVYVFSKTKRNIYLCLNSENIRQIADASAFRLRSSRVIHFGDVSLGSQSLTQQALLYEREDTRANAWKIVSWNP